MTDFSRLIEHAFPLKQASLDSVHEKNVRHGHISTLHIWPARRPLAACRAALIATLLPDPGDPEKRRELCEKIGGKVVKKIEKKKMPGGQTVERVKEETEGGILHWGRETENAETLNWFREQIKKAYGGRAPKVLDPFAGGGTIPLEAMRLGCEATAVDYNPVAWFVLKCTLEYPQKLAGQTRALPEFILHSDAFMAEFFAKAKGYGKAETKAALKRLHDRLKKKSKRRGKDDQASLQFVQEAEEATDELQADLAWHVRAWGQRILDRARRELAQFYPTYSDFEPIKKDHLSYEHQPMRLVPLKEDGSADIDSLNGEFTREYLEDDRNPRWVAKPTVAYLWARTVTCKNCRADIPLIKTRWLSKKANNRVLLTIEKKADRTGVVFGTVSSVASKGGNAAQKREHDRKLGIATMNKAGARCPCCDTIMAMENIRVCGRAREIGATLAAVVTEGLDGKEYRSATPLEISIARDTSDHLEECFASVPFGIPREPTPGPAGARLNASSLLIYGLTEFRDLFTSRQLYTLGTLVKMTREVSAEIQSYLSHGEFAEAVQSYLAVAVDRTANYMSTVCVWDPGGTEIKQTFLRFALPMTWDFAEANPFAGADRYYSGAISSIARVMPGILDVGEVAPSPTLINGSAITTTNHLYDVILTDPPYYDAIPYANLMDFFYIWLRRLLQDRSPAFSHAFATPLTNKWDYEANDGELIDDCARFDKNPIRSKAAFEDGMARAFTTCSNSLSNDGRMVVVFANKQPDAWETLVSAIIRSGFIVDGSWPIVTEMRGGVRNLNRASLASSVWLVCKKRPLSARPGWDNNILEEMKANIAVRLREYWDAGIRGPDFVWAATGPAMEAYSKHPVVRKANEPNATMGVGEFLNHVRRMVVDYVVGQVLTGERGSDLAAADRLDEVTAYYLLHRHDFGLDEAPVGACILYATACGLSDTELDRTWDILARTGSDATATDRDEEESDGEGDGNSDVELDDDTSGGSKVKLRPWSQRRDKNMGYEAPQGRVVPLIDRIHRVMHLWKDGDVQKVDEYLDQHALRRNELFKRVVQSLIELSTNSERSLLESISNHIGAKGAVKDRGPELPFGEEE